MAETPTGASVEATLQEMSRYLARIAANLDRLIEQLAAPTPPPPRPWPPRGGKEAQRRARSRRSRRQEGVSRRRET